MPERLDLLETIYTNRAIRRFRPDPIPDDVLCKVIEAATQAPSGANAQLWRFVVVRDPETRRRIGDVYRQVYDQYRPPEVRAATTDPSRRLMDRTTSHLAEQMGTEPPVLVVVCLPSSGLAGPGNNPTMARARGASIYLAIQNLLLGARAYGLAGCMTTIHLDREQEVKDILGIPDDIDTYAIIPLGYPDQHFGSLRRQPVEAVTFADRWGAPLPSIERP